MSDEEKQRLTKNKSQPGQLDELKRHRQLILEIMLVRHTEAYLSYLADLLFEIFTQRPETLRSSDRVEVSQVLQHDSIRDLVRELAQRKVDSLSYSSFADLAEFFSERFRLAIAPDETLSKIVEAIEIRNISVHNRCVINEKYVSRLGLAHDCIGKRRALGIEYLDLLLPMFCHSVRSLDGAARKKLGLKGVRFASTQPRIVDEPKQD